MSEKTGKPKLLYIITKTELGGAQSHVLDLVRGFVNRYEVHLAAGQTGILMEQAQEVGATTHLLPRLKRSINPLADFAAVRECVRLIRRLQPDLIHAHSSKAGIVGRLAGHLTRVPTIFTAHGWGFSPGVPRARQLVALRVEKVMARFASKIICVSEFDFQLALKHRVGNLHTLATVHNGIAPIDESLRADPRIHPPRLIMVARFSGQKDQALLLHALKEVKEEWFLDFVGSGPQLAACQQISQSLGLSERVAFLGDCNDVPELLRRSQIFVLSTHYEGLPISILEAMRVGLPVVASHVGGIGEQVLQEQSGLLVPGGDAAAFSKALRLMIRSSEARKRMGQAGRHHFEKNFSLQNMLNFTEQIYQQALIDNFDR